MLITAGGTREPLDSVRFLGNRSSGRMGVALAEEARRRGAEVMLLAANLAVAAPHGVEMIPTPTAEAMFDAALALPDVDVAAARCGGCRLRPAEALAGKRAKDEGGWTVELEATKDIAQALGGAKQAGQVLVAFGAEHGEEGLERKRAMLETKNADLVVFNDIGQPGRRVRRGRERGRAGHRARPSTPCHGRARRRSLPRSSTRSRSCVTRESR